MTVHLRPQLAELRAAMKEFIDGAVIPAEPSLGGADPDLAADTLEELKAEAKRRDLWALGHLATCDIHIATGTGPWEKSEESYRLSAVLASRAIRHHLDDWGPLGGHDWRYWKHQMREYLKG